MCGICGKIVLNPQQVVSEELLERMTRTLVHRGPDAGGCVVNGPVGLGHRRLSIIDLEGGKQPMSNQRQDVWIVFNGEIYNFRELRKELEQDGACFSTQSDTEVILHLYDRDGVACLKRLRGMFAFALWDNRLKRLVLARDRVGKKPLFYRRDAEAICFASEIKALLQDPACARSVNVRALSNFLTYQYVPPPDTMFEQIHKLPPAHVLICEKGIVSIEPYWELRYTPKVCLPEEELVARTTELLQEAVRLRMISDVPLGAFLSGGLDSSLIVALMAQHSLTPIKTFSIGFEAQDFNELPYARLVAERYGTEHHEFLVKPQAVEILPDLIWHFDEPFGDSSAIPTYYVSQMTSRWVKVALNGDGGDEACAGYPRYLGYQALTYYQRLPLTMRRRLLTPLIDYAAGPTGRRLCPRGYDAIFRRLKYFHDLSLQSREDLYIRRLTIFQPPLKQELLSADVLERLQGEESLDYMRAYFRRPNADHFIDQMLYADVMTYLPGDLLVKVDRMTMAHGLEGRSPFLDHVLMEFWAALPPQVKRRGRHLKYLLKRVAAPWLPQTILTRQKQGFGMPIGQWFRNELREMLHDSLTTSHLVKDGWLRGPVIERIVQEHQAHTSDHQHRLWVLLNLELWYRHFISHGCASNS